MAEKKKSIIEEALLEAKSLEDALKANTKEMLAAHMSREIESIVESSLKKEDEKEKEEISEDDEEITVDDAETKGSDDGEEDVMLDLKDEDSDDDESDNFNVGDSDDTKTNDVDLDLDRKSVV